MKEVRLRRGVETIYVREIERAPRRWRAFDADQVFDVSVVVGKVVDQN